MGGNNSTVERASAANVEFDKVRKDILKVMDSPDWDDGSYAPILIRLGWHSSGTYDKKDGSGGSDGATMRHKLEANDPDNAGLKTARDLLIAVKNKHPGLTFADLWILAAYCAIEHTGGPVIEFTGGRVDAPEEKAIAPGRLPNPEKGASEAENPNMEVDEEGRIKGWEKNAEHIREVFGRMGFNDREMVALICGGHVYGRCHQESSGYAGAWVENPTFFSNEYAADMFGDKWILVGNDTILPNGERVPEEIRPVKGKRQYIDLSKIMPEEDEEEAKNRNAPDAENFPPGAYSCVSDWVNVREQADVSSPIVGRVTNGTTVNLVSVKVFGTAMRGRCERGGWVSIVGSAGKTLFERKGAFDSQIMSGKWRRTDKVSVYSSTTASGAGDGSIKNELFNVSEVASGTEDGKQGAVFGKVDNGSWAMLYSPKRGLVAELVIQGYNEKARKPIKGQDGNQMMLISDMVMMWDPSFCKVLQEYADDQEVLSRDFGLAFKRLTELGCPWSKDGGSFKVGGCPFACGA